MRVKVQYKSI